MLALLSRHRSCRIGISSDLLPPPKVIHLRIGNIKFKQMEEFISRNWETIRNLSDNHKLVTVYLDRIEVVA
jgi:predicted nuclease of predicted toxin-antitoxin system